ncbi:MAG: NADH-quinone oxidoreductase subunit C [Chthoniobacteraceae bacterium]
MSSKLSADVSAIEKKFAVLKKTDFRGETTLLVERASIKELCSFCKDELGYTYLVDISGVDNFGEEPRFEVVYELCQFERVDYLRLKIRVSEDELSVSSVSDIWPTADWHEREAFDMFGVVFDGHPDLRRIIMWEGYPFHPLRKDFPLAGKASDVPEVAFTSAAPLAGGPFVTIPTTGDTQVREPRSREA